jgi:type I site-specific restriction-modification system R (restriction) subunit
MPVLSDRRDIIVLTDEAHRSQYDTLALNMRTALPNALFLAFTGTPLIAGEERTREVFGNYVSVYNFQESVEDGATVPLFYENRTPELRLENPDLNQDLYALGRLKKLLVLDWRQRVGARAVVRDAIEKQLDDGLPRAYTPELYQAKVSSVFEHIFESYPGEGTSVFSM